MLASKTVFSSFLSVSSVRFWPVVCMQGMTTHFKTSKALKVSVRSLKSVSLDFLKHPDMVLQVLFLIPCSRLAGQEGGGWECPGTQRWWVGGHVSAGAQPAPAWADQGGCRAVEAAAKDPEKQGLRRQLPHQTRHPERGAGETKDRIATGGGQTGPRECQHEVGAGCPASQVWSPAVFCPDCDPWALLTRQGGHHQCHHHCQVSQPQQLQPDPILSSLLVLTGLGFPSPAWSFPVLTQPEPTHPVLTGRSVVTLRDGMGWQALCDVILHSQLCLPSSVSYTIYTVCALCKTPPWTPAPAGYWASMTLSPWLIGEICRSLTCLNMAALT